MKKINLNGVVLFVCFILMFVVSNKVETNSEGWTRIIYLTILIVSNSCLYYWISKDYKVYDTAMSGAAKVLNFIMIQTMIIFDLVYIADKFNLKIPNEDFAKVLIFIISLNVVKSVVEILKYLKNNKLNNIDCYAIVICSIVFILINVIQVYSQLEGKTEKEANSIIIVNYGLVYLSLFYLFLWPAIKASEKIKGLLPIIIVAFLLFVFTGTIQDAAFIITIISILLIFIDLDNIDSHSLEDVQLQKANMKNAELRDRKMSIIFYFLAIYISIIFVAGIEDITNIKSNIGYSSFGWIDKVRYSYLRGSFICLLAIILNEIIKYIFDKSGFKFNQQLNKQKIIENEKNEILMQRELERLQKENEILKQDDERMQREYERMKNKHKINLRKYSRKV